MLTNNTPHLHHINVVLVFPPYQESDDGFFIKTAKREFGKIPPLALCAVAATLEKHNAKVHIIDANARNLSLHEVIDEIKEISPDFIGFTIATYQFNFTLSWIKEIRAVCRVPVVVGGTHIRLYPVEIMSHPSIDYCILGEAEEALPHLLYALIEKQDLASINGIAYRDAEGVTHTNNRSLFITDLDTVPYPARHLLDNTLYYSFISRYKNFTAMTTTRGCVFQCTFCDNQCIPYRVMSPQRVVNEMEQCQKEFDVREIDMFDGLFSLKKERLHEISNEMIKRKLTIAWSFRTRADLVDRETLQLLKKAGCIRIYYGIESGSPEILRNIKKSVNLETIRAAIKMTKKAGIEAFGYFMVGNFGENKETIQETMAYMLSLLLDYVQIAPIYYPPNTEIYKTVQKVMGYDVWKEYTKEPNAFPTLPIVETSFTRDEIMQLVRKMYLAYYLRPAYIIKYFTRMRSFDEIKRALRAIINMIVETVFCKRC